MLLPAAHSFPGSLSTIDTALPAGRHACLLLNGWRASATSRASPGRGRGRSRQPHARRCTAAAKSTARAGTVDRTLMVKLDLAKSSGRLDLSECQLEAVPPEVLDLADLEVGPPSSSQDSANTRMCQDVGVLWNARRRAASGEGNINIQHAAGCVLLLLSGCTQCLMLLKHACRS